uniref:Uncharacterized protein n=1 Tax=Astyanax mexicanus TaxID=7994 RepID=A0A3B1K529_ASTMX
LYHANCAAPSGCHHPLHSGSALDCWITPWTVYSWTEHRFSKVKPPQVGRPLLFVSESCVTPPIPIASVTSAYIVYFL